MLELKKAPHSLEFTPLEFETIKRVEVSQNEIILDFTPLEFETKLEVAGSRVILY